MDKFQNKYRIPSARLQNWDYGQNAAYFVTICTQDRECYFGNVEDGKMNLSGIGIIADVLWHEIKNHAKNVELGEFVVMPNHVHGIIIINKQDNANDGGGEGCRDGCGDGCVDVGGDVGGGVGDGVGGDVGGDDGGGVGGDVGDGVAVVETLHATSLQSMKPEQSKNEFMANISPKSNSLSTIIRSYKSAVSKHAHRLGFDFAWQSRFHDHIIRNDKSYQTISDYISNNPMKWNNDKFHSSNEMCEE